MEARRRAALALSSLLAALDHPLRIPGAMRKPQSLWPGSDAALARSLRLSGRDMQILAGFRRDYSHDEMVARLGRREVNMIAIGERDYPGCLARTHDPPPALFLAGQSRRLKEFIELPRIAIVGSRAASAYGYDVARFMAAGLARRQVGVVSGMALGIDAAAHDAVLAAGGQTIAVLGCGPDVIYPAANRGLYRGLLKDGLVISEYPPGTPARPWRFPARNRLIAALADGVIVVEAAEKSGALITADFCLEQGGEVFAVPGSIFSRSSAGTNRLIRAGATPATSVEDVLEALGVEDAPEKDREGRRERSGADLVAEKVLGVLGPLPQSVDEIAGRCALDVQAVSTLLTTMELEGRLRFEPGRGYCI